MKRTIAVIGGGASGMMAAVTAAEHGAAVTIYESKERLGKKLLATGNGKCNYTNLYQTPECYRGTHPEFALEALNTFPVQKTIEFFEMLGIVPKVKNGYVYPNSGQAASVADALAMEVRERSITVMQESVREIRRTENGYHVITKEGAASYERVILCCGSPAGLPEKADFFGYSLAEALGLRLTPRFPALVQLRCAEKWLKTVSGVRTEGTVMLLEDGKPLAKEQGELLFADYGISGIPVFQISRFAGEALLKKKRVTCLIDFLPEFSVEDVTKLLWKRVEGSRGKTTEEALIGLLNHKLNYVLLKECGLSPTAPAKKELTDRKKTAVLAAAYKGLSCTVTATNPISNAQVCAGGISTEELDAKTLKSKRFPGLYAAGELIDIDGTCGGYNLQWAWSSGYTAGLHAATDA
ncbi:MAG: NAD(P)/FAD-dependent oxidoreductase [Lachnospiraceae bacterium]